MHGGILNHAEIEYINVQRLPGATNKPYDNRITNQPNHQKKSTQIVYAIDVLFRIKHNKRKSCLYVGPKGGLSNFKRPPQRTQLLANLFWQNAFHTVCLLQSLRTKTTTSRER